MDNIYKHYQQFYNNFHNGLTNKNKVVQYSVLGNNYYNKCYNIQPNENNIPPYSSKIENSYDKPSGYKNVNNSQYGKCHTK